MTQRRWEQAYDELQRRAEKIGYDPPTQLGSGTSQVFEFRSRRKPVLLLAFRDLARKKDYKVHNRLWAEGLDLVLDRYNELTRQGKPLPRAAAIVVDNKSDVFIVVMMDELLALYRRKGALGTADGHRRLTFVVQKEEDRYALQMPFGEPPVPLTAVNSVDTLVLLLKTAKEP